MSACFLMREPSAWAQASPPPSAAAPSKTDLSNAKKHYDDGEAKFRAGDYGGAEIDFRIANNIKATPQAERYIGRCLEELGRYAAAVEWYEKFLAHVPEKMSSLADRTRKRTVAIRAMPGKLHIESKPTGASISIDGQSATATAPLDVELAPGTHTLTFVSPGRVKFEKSVEVAFASTQTVNAELDPADTSAPAAAATPAQPPAEVAETEESTPPAHPAAPPAEPPRTEPPNRTPAYVTGAVAVVAAGVGAIFGIMALNDAHEYSIAMTQDNASNRNTHALIADLALGSALAFGVTSTVLFLTTKESAPASPTKKAPDDDTDTDKSKDKDEPTKPSESQGGTSFMPTPLVGPHFAGAGLFLRF